MRKPINVFIILISVLILQTGDQICTLGHEFGSVTGRKRRCGWIDLVALKYAIMVDGVTKLIMERIAKRFLPVPRRRGSFHSYNG